MVSIQRLYFINLTSFTSIMDKVSEIYAVLKKRRYNREKPYLTEDLKARLTYFVENDLSIKLVGFWGVGFKEKANWSDKASCEFLLQLNNEVKLIYPKGIRFVFIFATMHGIHNGVEKSTINSYVDDIKVLFEKYSFESIYLETLWEKYGISFEKINELFDKKSADWWEKVENAELIETNAKNRNERLTSREAAQKYFIMRTLEKDMLEKEFPESIFHAFSDSRLREVLPDMPTLYFYARKGWSDTPWFVTGEKP